jgi:hypothetical protein
MLLNDPVDWSSSGFNGFVQVGQLMENGCSVINDAPGVYLILRCSTEPPVFLEKGTGGWFKGIDPNVPLSVLREKWVEGTEIMYIGKAGTSLRKRLRHYMRFGDGIDAPHKGGRHIWQLADSRKLQVCWKVLPLAVDSEMVEMLMIEKFKDKCGKLPFANIAFHKANIPDDLDNKLVMIIDQILSIL